MKKFTLICSFTLTLFSMLTSPFTLAATKTTAQQKSLELYTTAWSEYSNGQGYPAYQYDGAFNSQEGTWNNRPIVHNPEMIAQFSKTSVVAWAFMQVWNPQYDTKYNVPASYYGLLHFSDLYGDLPPSNAGAITQHMLALCKTLGEAACSAIQVNGNTGQKQLFNYAENPTTGQFNSFMAFANMALPSTVTRIISLGGANLTSNDSVGYHTFQAIFANQAKFLDNFSLWLQAFPNIKGIDYDFEPPIDSSGGQLPPSNQTYTDYANLLSLVKATREKLGPNAYISVTITPNMDYLQYINNSVKDAQGQGDWFKQIAQYANTVNIMTYDFHGPWSQSGDPYTAIHSYLAQPNVPNLNKFAIQYGAEKVINQVLAYGMPADKLQMGIATYGRGYQGVPNQTVMPGLPGFDATWLTAANLPGQYSEQAGMLPYKFINTFVSSFGYQNYNVTQTIYGKSVVVGSYIYNPSTQIFVGYESPDEVKAVCDFIKAKGLKGAIMWSADTDLPVSNSDSLVSTYETACNGSS